MPQLQKAKPKLRKFSAGASLESPALITRKYQTATQQVLELLLKKNVG